MTARRRGAGDGGDKPPPSDWTDDPLMHPASEAGWDDERPPAPEPAAATTVAEPAAVEPAAAEPAAAEPAALEPAAVEPAAVEPAAVEPAALEPTALEPTAVAIIAEPAAPQPSGTAFPAFVPPASEPAAVRSGSIEVAPASAADTLGPLLPASYHENDLRSAVGASPLDHTGAATRIRKRPAHRGDSDDDRHEPQRPGNRKLVVVAALCVTAGLAIAGLVVLGRLNGDRYVLICESARAVPEQGRGFPPWGTRELDGDAWKPLKIAPEARCQPHETDDLLVLERLYLTMILDQATAQLTAREVTKLDDTEALLKQALLLTRPPEHEPARLATERSEHHSDIERMLGDVTYWRASAKLHDAEAALTEAAKQFDSAAAQHPRHVSDAPAWAAHARKLTQELHAGPAGAAQPATPSPPAAAAVPTAPAAPDMPSEPSAGAATNPAPEGPPALDAGVPTGGVLL